MANRRGELPIEVLLNDRPVAVESRYDWSGGGAVLTLTTVLPDRELALELISTYIGHPDTDTIVTHLLVSGALNARVETMSYSHHQLNTLGLARQCAYEHCNWLIEALTELGHTLRVMLDDRSFAELEAVL